MAIPETQLDTWSHQGSVTQSKDTYATIKKALQAADAPYAGKSFDSFLQGSYGNDTNIYADSDVDIVMKLDSVFYSDLSELSASEQAAHQSAYADASYQLTDFKKDVIGILRKKFGSDVDPGKKAIWIKPNGGRRNADVLVAAQFRRYYKFDGLYDERFAEGICFFLPDGTRIENFPRQHSENCTAKHQATRGWFKPMVRILKNMRNKLVDEGVMPEGLAPSYFLEGLLYNVPNENFGVSYGNTFTNCVNWITNADRQEFICASELYYLLRDGSPVTWRAASCDRFLSAAIDLWNQW